MGQRRRGGGEAHTMGGSKLNFFYKKSKNIKNSKTFSENHKKKTCKPLQAQDTYCKNLLKFSEKRENKFPKFEQGGKISSGWCQKGSEGGKILTGML